MNDEVSQTISSQGDAVGNVQVAGDNNRVQVKTLYNQKKMESVPENVVQSLSDLTTMLMNLKSDDTIKIENALKEVAHEVKKTKPDPEEIEDGLTRAIKVAKKAEGFIDVSNSLLPKLKTIGIWLGSTLAAATSLLT